MSESDQEQRTEEASDHKLEKAREEGKVVKSGDVVTAASLVALTVVLGATTESAATALSAFAERVFAFHDIGNPARALTSCLPLLTSIVTPVLLVAAVAGIASNVAQTGALFVPSLVGFDFERLNPATNLPNVIPGKKTLKEIGKQLLKVSVLGVVVYHVVSGVVPEFTTLAASSPFVGAATIGRTIMTLLVQTSMAFVALAGFDYWVAYRQFANDNMVSKQDQRDEHKEMEGRPEIKQRQRQKMREAARNRSAGSLKNATVLLTNPTHYAVALRYQPKRDAAPVLLMKGADAVSFRMRAEARRLGVPIIENRPLARALHAEGKVGKAIPAAHYRAVATVIAQVLRLSGAKS